MTPKNPQHRMAKVAVLGTYPPRRCGIATFTTDLVAALSASESEVQVDAVAMCDQDYDYPLQVTEQIAESDHLAYSFAAHALNRKGYDVLSVQHEYGIFGGEAGEYLLHLVREANMPVVTTLHTVLRSPTPKQRAVMDELLQLSTRIVVMSHTAISLLSEVHGVDLAKVDFIPHGIPEISPSAGESLRAEIGGNGPILLTFGLLSPDKGIEYGIQALPSLVANYPDAKYFVVGRTHPHVRTSSGETYRQKLVDLAAALEVTDHVEFVDEFVSLDRLVEYLSACHYYLTPYLNPMQITSGTLAYSLGAGKVVISTPFEYAKEVLAEGRGVLVPFADPGAISEAVRSTFECDIKRAELGDRAAEFGAQMHWDRVGQLYAESFGRAVGEARRLPKPVPSKKPSALPDISLNHLRAMTDDTGLLQHAVFTVPNRKEGYCVDDNARALMLAVALESHSEFETRVGDLRSLYLSFVADAWNQETGKFRNFMNYRREWLEDSGSEDSQARTLWALGATVGRSFDVAHAQLAAKLFFWAIPGLADSTSPRSWAYSVLGAAEFLEAFPCSEPAFVLLDKMALNLERAHFAHASMSWPWLEERLAYANARIPQAMMVAGQYLDKPELTNAGVEALTWLMDHQFPEGSHFSPVGSSGAGKDDFGTVQFDQQPLEAWSSISACITAHEVTSNPKYLGLAERCFEWFLGSNVIAVPLVNTRRGSCCDGLNPEGLNLNRGAESTLAYLSALTELQAALTPKPGSLVYRELP